MSALAKLRSFLQAARAGLPAARMLEEGSQSAAETERLIRQSLANRPERLRRSLEEGSRVFTPPSSASRLHEAALDSVGDMERMREMFLDSTGIPAEPGSLPSRKNTLRAFEQGFTLPGYRVTPYGDAAAIHHNSQTPGAHFAPLGREGQIFDILNKYLDEGVENFTPEFKPRVSLVYVRPGNIASVEDMAAEMPDVSAESLGLMNQYRALRQLYPGVNTRALIQEMLPEHGVDSLIYENAIEGLNQVSGEPRFIRGFENPSISTLKQENIREAAGFKRGGLAQVKKECSCGHK